MLLFGQLNVTQKLGLTTLVDISICLREASLVARRVILIEGGRVVAHESVSVLDQGNAPSPPFFPINLGASHRSTMAPIRFAICQRNTLLEVKSGAVNAG